MFLILTYASRTLAECAIVRILPHEENHASDAKLSLPVNESATEQCQLSLNSSFCTEAPIAASMEQ